MSTNWIQAYSGNKVRKFQAGGPMAAPEGQMAPAAPQGGAPDLEGMLMEYAQTRDPQLAVAIADALVEALAAQQGQAPAMARKGLRTSRGPIFKK
jgi:hypothetical protein